MQISIEGIDVTVTHKKIKRLHLRVYPPLGEVRVSAPMHVKLQTVRAFATFRLDWIRKQQEKVTRQARQAHREYINGEKHYYLGSSYALQIVQSGTGSSVSVNGSVIEMRPCHGATMLKRQSLLEDWYRERLKEIVLPLIQKWEGVMGVKVTAFKVRKMKTRWGSCNPGRGRINLNLELAKKPVECLEYVLVHEMVHLIEPGHGKKFKACMGRFLPGWELCKARLKHSP